MKKVEAPRCPSCGAVVDAPLDAAPRPCGYCKASLHPLRCPWCFAWAFAESPECPGCGSTPPEAPSTPLSCPSCRVALARRERGRVAMSGCAGCGGVWLDPQSLRRICEEQSSMTADLGGGALSPAPRPALSERDKVMYRPCAQCGDLMHRVNFAGNSGVVLDACRAHGSWFDADELAKIVAFIRAGGLDEARRREVRRLEQARRQTGQAGSVPPLFTPAREEFDEAAMRAAVASASGLLRALFG